LVRVIFLVAPFKRHMIEAMAARFNSVEYDIVTPRYPLPQSEWRKIRFAEKLDEKLLGGAAVRNAIRRFRPHVVYSDSPLYAAQFKLMSILSSLRAPLVLHLRGDVWREYWATFEMASIRNRTLDLQQFGYTWAAVTLAARITPICGWLQTVVRHYVPWKKSEVVYQGVSPEQFRPQEWFDALHPSVAIIQNHSIMPKVQGLLNFKRVVRRLPNVHFYIAEGEAFAQQFLEAVKQSYAGLTNVHFVKDVASSEAVSRMITACGCYVLASGLDCCPTTVLEASLLEKPVLASRVGGVPEIIADGYTGWTINNDNIEAWVNKIDMLLKDSKLSRKLGRQGRRWVSERFGWNAIAPQVERLIIYEATKSPLL